MRQLLKQSMLAGIILASAGLDARPAQTPPRVVHIAAERFSFTPSEIVAAPGEALEFHLTSDDTSHGFRIAGTPVNIAIPKRGRKAIVVPFTAPAAAGRYVFECSRMCGAGHNFMRGVLIVRERTGS